jgi:hypothetical protein
VAGRPTLWSVNEAITTMVDTGHTVYAALTRESHLFSPAYHPVVA